MKGVVFTEFLDFVAAIHGRDMADDIVEDAAPPHGGAYTAVGTYPHTEMAALVGALAGRVHASAPDLLSAFGTHLCRRFVVKFPDFFRTKHCLFDFLESVDSHIHVEVHKLYPDAELPVFRVAARSAGAMDLDYESCRPLEALAEGMIRAAAEHYGEPIAITKTRIEGNAGGIVRFSIRHAAGSAAVDASTKIAA